MRVVLAQAERGHKQSLRLLDQLSLRERDSQLARLAPPRPRFAHEGERQHDRRRGDGEPDRGGNGRRVFGGRERDAGREAEPEPRDATHASLHGCDERDGHEYERRKPLAAGRNEQGDKSD